MATVYVNKQRMQDHNALALGADGKPIEMGAVWSEPETADRKRRVAASGTSQVAQLHGGHFSLTTAPSVSARAVSSTQLPLPAWLLSYPLRFKEGHP